VVEPTLGFGLTKSSPDMNLGMVFRRGGDAPAISYRCVGGLHRDVRLDCQRQRQDTAARRAITDRPKTYADLKFAYTVRQERDFTCGAAALATVLKYHYGCRSRGDDLLDYRHRYNPEELKKRSKSAFPSKT